MERDVMVRRCAHLSVALAPVYYLIPEELPLTEAPREVLLFFFLSGVVLFDNFRLRRRIALTGLRPHECDSVASFVWAALGITIALWLFPMWIAIAVVVGMAVVDPLAGELRTARASPALSLSVPIAVYFGISAAALLLSGEFDTLVAIGLSAIGAILAVGAEAADIRCVDDDLLMIVVPGFALTALTLIL